MTVWIRKFWEYVIPEQMEGQRDFNSSEITGIRTFYLLSELPNKKLFLCTFSTLLQL
jgi:hypothetical protein